VLLAGILSKTLFDRIEFATLGELGERSRRSPVAKASGDKCIRIKPRCLFDEASVELFTLANHSRRMTGAALGHQAGENCRFGSGADPENAASAGIIVSSISLSPLLLVSHGISIASRLMLAVRDVL
jgi:hypothetical protein